MTLDIAKDQPEPDYEDISIIDQAGNILVDQLPTQYKGPEVGEKAAKLASQLVSNLNATFLSLKLGLLESILIQGENGKYCVLPAENDKFYITLVGNIG